jgi:DNA-binding beta-propeller fold protein YncE
VSGPIDGATGMALTPDGSSLWVAAATGDALVRVDTSSLAVVQTVALPAGTCPGDVAVVGTRVVYGYSCNRYGGAGSYGGLGVVDATTGVVLANVTTGPFYQPVVVAASGGQVYAADAALSPSSLCLYDVSGTPLQLIAQRTSVCENLQDLAASPDGASVVTACGWPYGTTSTPSTSSSRRVCTQAVPTRMQPHGQATGGLSRSVATRRTHQTSGSAPPAAQPRNAPSTSAVAHFSSPAV